MSRSKSMRDRKNRQKEKALFFKSKLEEREKELEAVKAELEKLLYILDCLK